MKLAKYLTEIITNKNILEILLRAAINKKVDDKKFREMAVKHLRRLI